MEKKEIGVYYQKPKHSRKGGVGVRIYIRVEDELYRWMPDKDVTITDLDMIEMKSGCIFTAEV